MTQPFPEREQLLAENERLREELGDISKLQVRERTATNLVDEANTLQEALDAISELYGRSVDERATLRAQLAKVVEACIDRTEFEDGMFVAHCRLCDTTWGMGPGKQERLENHLDTCPLADVKETTDE